ncbi:MAG: AAA family ATPase, partial [Acidimicrobiaceae bacterium]|nr:AAA family ATPase [Acidimicrobiaceae bacterium]
MRTRAQELLSTVGDDNPDLEWALSRRVRALAESPRALCFGRTDADDGTTWYVGRRHVEDEHGDPVVIEWRAPVAVPFYRASWSEPMGLARRRQFVVDGRRLLSIGDDTFGRAQGAEETDRLRGQEALLLELERARSGEMLDIVATIQPEQDEVIRAPAPGIMAVQGGPGSGKTAVGLHRAAFLLYGNEAMARANILVVGPNRTFLRYIAQVLPSLGEHAVVQTTLVDLVPEIDGARDKAGLPRTDAPDAEHLKGDLRMADVIARSLAARRRPSPDDLTVNLGLRRLVVPAADVDAAAAAIARRRLPYATGRAVLRDQLVRMLSARAGDAVDSAQVAQLRVAPGLAASLDSRWPSVAPAALVAELLSKRAHLGAAAEGILDTAEQRLLLRRTGRAWTTADAPLVDEAKALISGQSRTYGHAIVDEAQDLSPMELRMLARRCPSG